MKKKIGFVPMDPVLGAWLLEMLAKEPPESDNAGGTVRRCAGLTAGGSDLPAAECLRGGRSPFAKQRACSWGELEIFPKSRRVLMQGREISLTPKEFDILWFLAQNRGEVFTKEQIYRAVWSDNYLLDDSNIMAFIRKLRKKIEPDPDAPRYILTLWGIGYKFNDQL